MLKFTFHVEFTVPDTQDARDDEGYEHGFRPNERSAREYVLDAISCWGKQNHPDDPFFSISDVAVKRKGSR